MRIHLRNFRFEGREQTLVFSFFFFFFLPSFNKRHDIVHSPLAKVLFSLSLSSLLLSNSYSRSLPWGLSLQILKKEGGGSSRKILGKFSYRINWSIKRSDLLQPRDSLNRLKAFNVSLIRLIRTKSFEKRNLLKSPSNPSNIKNF